MFDIIEGVERWLSEGQTVALATVVATWGSSPRQAGAKMAVTQDMAMIGSVSGGCVENAVIEEAIESLQDRQPRLLRFGVSDDTAWDVGLACGGTIEVYVEPLDTVWWTQVSSALRENRSTTTLTVLQGELAGEKLLTDATGNVLYATPLLDATTQAILAVRDGKTSRQTIGNFDVLVDVHRSRPRLILVGGGHVAVALHQFAQQLGFRVALIDPRTAFSTQERFPHAESILHSYPDKALPQVGIDAETYIAVLTHDPKIDDPALQIALASPAAYIGVLSSRRAHEQRTQRLTEKGVDPELFGRIHTPIGLPIEAQTPEEIALCIMAEIVAVRNGAHDIN